jgi:hypothetical protein
MLTRVLALLFPALFASLAACSRNAGGCAVNTDCPDGHVCLSDRCEQICSTDADCVAGRYCDGEICIIGRRDSPVISGVTGNGDANACLVATGKPCLGTAFVVTGSNLGGSAFKLVSSLPNGPQYNLTVAPGGRLQDAVVDLVPSISGPVLQEGSYLLTATNAAGSAQAPVDLLKGEKGDKGDPGSIANLAGDDIVSAINDSTTTLQILAARVAGGGGGGGTRYVYVDSTAPITNAVSGNRMVVQVTGSTTAAVTMDLKSTPLATLCADFDGCTIRLGVTQWHPYGDAVTAPTTSEVIAAPLVGAPCHLSIDGDGNWAVSTACTQWYATWVPGAGPSFDPTWPASGNPGFYSPYRSAMWGNDGGDAYSGVILHNFACYLSEAAPTGSAAGFEADSAAGLYFTASHPAWAGAYFQTGYWVPTDSARACILIVED